MKGGASEQASDVLRDNERSLALNPDQPELWFQQGNLLQALQRSEEALASYDAALARSASNTQVLVNRGAALQSLNRLEEAVESYQQVLAVHPQSLETLNNLGCIYRRLNQPEQALQYFNTAISIQPGFTAARYNRGTVLLNLKRYEEAIDNYRQLLALDPEHPYATGKLFFFERFCADWHTYDVTRKKIIEGVSQGHRIDTPLDFLGVSDSAVLQRQCAERFGRDRYPQTRKPLWQGERYTHQKIRLAYVSADFREHAVSVLMAGVFEQHDRSRFEVIAISLRPPEPSPLGQRVKSAFDEFIDVSGRSDLEVATLMREREIDIAIDLTGYTADGRTGIFCHRPAPIQMNYLGYPGTMGLPCMDYLIADDFLIPESLQKHYSENILYLPDCFQANDDKRRTASARPTRASVGLPETGMVFCSFNNSHKLSPEFFAIWMRLLKAVDGSVLWLLADHPAVRTNLCREAEAQGVDPGRLVFAERIPYGAHLARLALADLFLDARPFNAGTTASDALWVGVPVLTCVGEAFASRMAGSLLTASGLPELITTTTESYETLARELALNPGKLRSLRERLERKGKSGSLFDTQKFCRYLETGYQEAWQRYQRGETPATIRVSGAPSISAPLMTKSPVLEIVSATRLTEEAFWKESALGLSLRRLSRDTRLKASIAFENRRGLPEVYNARIRSQEPCDYLVFIHDDVWIDDLFFADRILEGCKSFDLIGVAGNRRRVPKQPGWPFIDIANQRFVADTRANLSGSVAHGKTPLGEVSMYGPSSQACEVLDGLFLAAPKALMQSQQLLFEESLSFHFYDLDICRSFRERQLRVGTWPIALTHQSHGAYGTAAWQEGYRRYLDKWKS